eukprot:1751810-Pyramimonas_sp.AAC.1
MKSSFISPPRTSPSCSIRLASNGSSLDVPTPGLPLCLVPRPCPLVACPFLLLDVCPLFLPCWPPRVSPFASMFASRSSADPGQ